MSDFNSFPGHFPTRWSVVDVILVFVLLIILMGITSAYAPGINDFFADVAIPGMNPRLTLFFFSALLQSLYMIFIIACIAWYRKINFREAGLHAQNLGHNLVVGTAGGILLFMLVVFLGILVMVVSRTVPPQQDVAVFLLEMEGAWPRLLAFFLSAVMAPLSEELYFRGMVFPVFRHKLGRTAAIILSGIIFSLAHRDLYRFIPIAAGGMGLAWLFDRTNSLWTSIVAHSTWNAVMMILMITSSGFVP